MTKIETTFLAALKAALQHDLLDSATELTGAQWQTLFRLAEVHHVTPMIYESVYKCASYQQAGEPLLQQVKRASIRLITGQTIRSGSFQGIYQALLSAGVTPAVVKGIICRSLYPNPDARVSGDEDVFIPEDQFDICHKVLLEAGLVLAEPEQDIRSAHEVAYHQPETGVYIEVHKHLFPPESEAYGDLNRFFDGIFAKDTQPHQGENGITRHPVEGVGYFTLNPTDHLLYLILHAFKHFLHSGFGIRQVCDICIFADTFGSAIDWSYVLDSCRDVRADLFAGAVFAIGDKYLGFPPEKAGRSEEWDLTEGLEVPMLADLLQAGVFGQADMSRKHSSNITLNAVIADKRGATAGRGKLGHALQSVFLPLHAMEKRYTYLKTMPVLLPVAWSQRVIQYLQETREGQAGNNAAESLTIGAERVELLKQYGIIK